MHSSQDASDIVVDDRDNYAQNAVHPHSEGKQTVHADHLPVFPSDELHDRPHATTMAVVNVPLCEFTVENGAT